MINDANSDDNDDVGGDIVMTIPIMIIDHAGDHNDCCDEDAHDDDLDEGNDGDDLNPKSFPLKGRKSRGMIIIVAMMMIAMRTTIMMIVMMTPMMMILIRKALHCSP